LYNSTGRVFRPETRGGAGSSSGRFDSDARLTSDCGEDGSRYGTSSLASRVTGTGAIDCPQARSWAAFVFQAPSPLNRAPHVRHSPVQARRAFLRSGCVAVLSMGACDRFWGRGNRLVNA